LRSFHATKLSSVTDSGICHKVFSAACESRRNLEDSRNKYNCLGSAQVHSANLNSGDRITDTGRRISKMCTSDRYFVWGQTPGVPVEGVL
jgi:hypothetical protein